jgi:hypothetical protein
MLSSKDGETMTDLTRRRIVTVALAPVAALGARNRGEAIEIAREKGWL